MAELSELDVELLYPLHPQAFLLFRVFATARLPTRATTCTHDNANGYRAVTNTRTCGFQLYADWRRGHGLTSRGPQSAAKASPQLAQQGTAQVPHGGHTHHQLQNDADMSETTEGLESRTPDRKALASEAVSPGLYVCVLHL